MLAYKNDLNHFLVRLAIHPDVTQGNLNEALRTIAEGCSPLLKIDSVVFLSVDDSTKAVHILEKFDHAQKQHASGNTLSANSYNNFLNVISTERFLAVDDVLADSRITDLSKDFWMPMKVKSSLIAPIRTNHMVDGFILFNTQKTGRVWKDEEISFACQIADLVTKCALQSEIAVRRRLITDLNTVSSTLNALYTTQDAIQKIGLAMFQMLDPDAVVVYQRSPDNTVSCEFMRGLSETHKEKVASMKANVITSILMTNTMPLIISDLASNPMANDTLTSLFQEENLRSLNFWPLIRDGYVVGSMGCCYRLPHVLTQAEHQVMQTFANISSLTQHNAWLYNQLSMGYQEVALSLARWMDMRETRLPKYSDQLAQWTEETARAFNLSEGEIDQMRWAALLHDIGKIVIPDEVLRKPGPLSKDEWKIVQKHPVEGERILRQHPVLAEVGTIVRHTREHFDGTGYPDRQKGDEIPLGARILAVADAYGSMIDQRSYHTPRSREEAIAELNAQRGKQFDPRVVEVFTKTVTPSKN